MNRRNFLTGIAATVTVGTLISVRSRADEAARVSEDDPTAKALGYVHDVANADQSLVKEGSNCLNCQLYQGAADSEWGGCAIFPGKQVAANGWCKSWVPKSS